MEAVALAGGEMLRRRALKLVQHIDPEVMTLAGREGNAGVTIAASTQFWQCSSAPAAANLPEPLRVRGFTNEVTTQ